MSRERRVEKDIREQCKLGTQIAVKDFLAIHCQRGSVRVRGVGSDLEYQRVQLIPAASAALNTDTQLATDQATNQPTANQPDSASETPDEPMASDPANSNCPAAKTRAKKVVKNPALEQVIAAIKKLLAEADRGHALVRYEAAEFCRQVCDGEGRKAKYGQNAVRKLARA